MTASLNPSYVIKHVVSDLERIRALLQHDAEKSRRWDLGDPGQVVLGDDHLNDVVNRLDEAVRLLCHAIDPNQHSMTVRKDVLEATAASELEEAAS